MTREEEFLSRKFTNLINSCVAGFHEDWDVSTDEGREGFLFMYDDLMELAERLQVDVSEAKTMDLEDELKEDHSNESWVDPEETDLRDEERERE